jgi:G protein-coupled receptor GPR1
MIAVHTALYIFRPTSSRGEGGLYPYRHIAYTFWVIFPLLMASLAFINDRNAYVSEGTYCYLPVRPFWYRLALGWIPRYLIFIFILCIYVSIYYYVRYKFRGFNKLRRSSNPNDDSQRSDIRQPRPVKLANTAPPTPTLACHGLIPESRQASSLTDGELGRLSSSSPSRSNKLRKPLLNIGAHRFMWSSMAAPETSPQPPSESSVEDADSFTGPSTPHPIPPPAVAFPNSLTPIYGMEPATAQESRNTSWGGAFVRRFSPKFSSGSNQSQSIIDMFTVLRQHPDQSSSTTPLSQLQLVNSRGQTYADAEILRTRDKIRRQLRFLFIYPLVYVGMWVVPFISHVLQYDDKYARNPPFALNCITTIFVCSQAAIDCWLFSTREKPWRHIPGNQGSLWPSLKFWSGWKGVSERRKVHHGPGKTREEMVREARAAYQRRDREMAARRNDSSIPNGEATKKGERSWWETPGQDGAMSPVNEEISNPMEDVVVSDGEGNQELGSDEDATSGSEFWRSLEKPVFVEHHEDDNRT